MNEFLKSASQRFVGIQKKDYIIAPLSLVDCEVIVEISELFSKLGRREVVEILKNYKYLKDEEVRDQLMELNIEFNKEVPEVNDSIEGLLETIKKLEEELKNKRDFITIGEDQFVADYIFHFRTDIHFDVDENFIGKLILNPSPKDATKLPYYANYTFIFHSELRLKKAVNSLKAQLSKSGVEFINDKNTKGKK